MSSASINEKLVTERVAIVSNPTWPMTSNSDKRIILNARIDDNVRDALPIIKSVNCIGNFSVTSSVCVLARLRVSSCLHVGTAILVSVII